MTIDEAIRLLSPISEMSTVGLHLEEQKAIRLGIEALKRVKTNRQRHHVIDQVLLPGETEE